MSTDNQTRNEVRALLQRTGLTIKSDTRLPNDTGFQIRTAEGPVVNIFDNGTRIVQGKNQHLVSDIKDQLTTGKTNVTSSSRKVFVVYGHDNAAKIELEAMLRR